MSEGILFTVILLGVIGIISSVLFMIFNGINHFEKYGGYTPGTELRWHLSQTYMFVVLASLTVLWLGTTPILIYLVFGVAWSMMHWIRRTRKAMKKYSNQECTYDEMIKHIDASKHSMYIVTDILLWPVRIIYGVIMMFKGFINEPNKEFKLFTGPIGAIYTNLGVSKAERVELKLKKD